MRPSQTVEVFQGAHLSLAYEPQGDALGYGIAGLSARGLSCNGPMTIIKFKTTHTTFTTFTTLVTPQRGDNIDNFLLGRRPNDGRKTISLVFDDNNRQ